MKRVFSLSLPRRSGGVTTRSSATGRRSSLKSLNSRPRSRPSWDHGSSKETPENRKRSSPSGSGFTWKSTWRTWRGGGWSSKTANATGKCRHSCGPGARPLQDRAREDRGLVTWAESDGVAPRRAARPLPAAAAHQGAKPISRAKANCLGHGSPGWAPSKGSAPICRIEASSTLSGWRPPMNP